MLAARDQENLVHGLQAAAASKPLNQGIRQHPPKTPNNKPLKTPFKLPLNDENNAMMFGGGAKLGLKTASRGNENLRTVGKKEGLGDKNTFVTPMGPRNRAPLGVKTTNAKARAFQTPAPVMMKSDPDNQLQKSATTRKPKARISHADMTKLEILGDTDVLEERDIEYMPLPVNNLPNVPDDMPQDIDTSMFENGGLMRDYMYHFVTKKEADGLSFLERQEMEQQERYDRADKTFEAMLLRDIESAPIPCVHDPECPGEECKAISEYRREAEDKFKRTMASIEPNKATMAKNPALSKGPSISLSKRAATALSQPKPSAIKPKPSSSIPNSRLAASLISNRKKTPPPTNPSPMRYAAATAASRNTLGYSKGRSTSATLRKTILQGDPCKSVLRPEMPDTSLPPALYIHKYGLPKVGTEMWRLCKDFGYFDEDDTTPDFQSAESVKDVWKEQAEEEFQFVL